LGKLRIVICDENIKEATEYEEICRRICEEKGISALFKQYVNADDFMADMSEKRLVALADIVLIEPKDSFAPVPEALRGKGYDGIMVFLSRSTAFEQALYGYDTKAYNYIVKGDDEFLTRFTDVFSKVLNDSQRLNRQYVILQCGGKNKLIALNDIYYFESAAGHTVICRYKGGEYKFISSLSAMENRLSDQGFIRIHQSFLVQVEAIDWMTKKKLTMKNGETLPITRNKDTLRSAINSRAL